MEVENKRKVFEILQHTVLKTLFLQGGIYFFQLIDYYAAALSLMYLAFFEVIAVTWFYGIYILHTLSFCYSFMLYQGSNRLEKYLNLEGYLKSLKIKSA